MILSVTRVILLKEVVIIYVMWRFVVNVVSVVNVFALSSFVSFVLNWENFLPNWCIFALVNKYIIDIVH